MLPTFFVRKDFPQNLQFRYTNSGGTAIEPHQPVWHNNAVCVAAKRIEPGATGIVIAGVTLEGPKTSAQAWDLGADVNFNFDTGVFTTVSADFSDIFPAGWAAEAAANPSAAGKVRLALPTRAVMVEVDPTV